MKKAIILAILSCFLFSSVGFAADTMSTAAPTAKVKKHKAHKKTKKHTTAAPATTN
jgi:hypothetical protein